MNNAIFVIKPFKWHGMWVFDDEPVGLDKEPFVAGADTMIDTAVRLKGIPNADDGFLMVFSAQPFPDADFELDWLRPDDGGGQGDVDLVRIKGPFPGLLHQTLMAPGRTSPARPTAAAITRLRLPGQPNKPDMLQALDKPLRPLRPALGADQQVDRAQAGGLEVRRPGRR